MYFSSYPNNIFFKGLITLVQNWIAKPFAGFFTSIIPILDGLTSYDVTYFIFVVFNCSALTITCLMLDLIVNKYFGSKVAMVSFVFLALFLGLNQWILVPYTDIFSMFFVTCIIFVYVFISNKTLKWFFILFFTITGYNLKPNVIFAFIALIAVELLYVRKLKISVKIVMPIASSFIAIVMAIALCGCVKDASHFEVNNNRSFSASHYLMMGLNTDSEGFYSNEDVTFSRRFNNPEKRKEANLEKAQERINEMGLGGLTYLLAKKIQANYADGTFMWGKDGGGFFYKNKRGDNPIINFIYDNISPFSNILWFIVLLGGLFILKRSNYNKCFYVVCLTLIAQSLFLTIFECGARHMIIYLPFYFILSMFGWRNYYIWFTNNHYVKKVIVKLRLFRQQ